jgi:hypothetical protein
LLNSLSSKSEVSILLITVSPFFLLAVKASNSFSSLNILLAGTAISIVVVSLETVGFYSGTESIRASVWNTSAATAAAATTARFLISS